MKNFQANNSNPQNSIKILGQSAQGYIGQCDCCDHFNFVYGNVLFIFTLQGLRNFHEVLEDKLDMHHLSEPLPNGKDHLLPSPIPNFMLAFNSHELKDISHIFQETFLAIEIEKLISS